MVWQHFSGESVFHPLKTIGFPWFSHGFSAGVLPLHRAAAAAAAATARLRRLQWPCAPPGVKAAHFEKPPVFGGFQFFGGSEVVKVKSVETFETAILIPGKCSFFYEPFGNLGFPQEA